ncbi:SRPBCC family protein [Oharaeibacter diazotrophicus]|uniref:Polyketide cyclase/dehydrase/lipid transport protein n=1 Tax=Oharaeibacter diazotrophicus TaxID=1920512 RepID=A0A4R6RBH5_9HYPH|nr:SRPBCC family protein [Oharaeibacter diazotrophicus]TDP83384.1 polyketide cyclase/dehydrase/lipid transport protein [Oharaeibacter diazotrophicus]BBE72217.1 polyketide cyclase / dehydrase and lipid transport [Pleomorphomonas sp. SM30]GLS78985.1 MxaD family protein [Oharaeibacter diazotrophicus]
MKSLFAASIAVAVAFTPVVASAHGPTRQKVEITTEVAAPADKTWAVVSNFGDMSWLPVVTKLEATGNDVGAERTITLANGEVIKERIEKFDAGKMMMMYRMEADNIKALPVTNYSSRLTVKDAGGGKSTITWWGAFYRGYPNNDPPADLSDEAAVKAITDLYNTGLAGMKKKIEGGS